MLNQQLITIHANKAIWICILIKRPRARESQRFSFITCITDHRIFQPAAHEHASVYAQRAALRS